MGKEDKSLNATCSTGPTSCTVSLPNTSMVKPSLKRAANTHRGGPGDPTAAASSRPTAGGPKAARPAPPHKRPRDSSRPLVSHGEEFADLEEDDFMLPGFEDLPQEDSQREPPTTRGEPPGSVSKPPVFIDLVSDDEAPLSQGPNVGSVPGASDGPKGGPRIGVPLQVRVPQLPRKRSQKPFDAHYPPHVTSAAAEGSVAMGGGLQRSRPHLPAEIKPQTPIIPPTHAAAAGAHTPAPLKTPSRRDPGPSEADVGPDLGFLSSKTVKPVSPPGIKRPSPPSGSKAYARASGADGSDKWSGGHKMGSPRLSVSESAKLPSPKSLRWGKLSKVKKTGTKVSKPHCGRSGKRLAPHSTGTITGKALAGAMKKVRGAKPLAKPPMSVGGGGSSGITKRRRARQGPASRMRQEEATAIAAAAAAAAAAVGLAEVAEASGRKCPSIRRILGFGASPDSTGHVRGAALNTRPAAEQHNRLYNRRVRVL